MKEIEQEIIDIHNFFIAWFTGKSDVASFNDELASRFYNETKFISTKGETINYDNLMKMFKEGYGKMNPNFKIEIRDIEILQEIGAYILVNYIEWQTSDSNPEMTGNHSIRKTTALISRKAPFKWLHIHETMMPKPGYVIEKWKS